MSIISTVVNFLTGAKNMDKTQIEEALAQAIKDGDQADIGKYEAALFALAKSIQADPIPANTSLSIEHSEPVKAADNDMSMK